MTEKPTALRLADDCDEGMVDFAEVAAELRRLHEVVQHLLRERNINLESAQRDTARIAELEKQRDELLEALKKLEYSSDGCIKRYPEEAEVNAAIARAEGRQ